MSVVYLCIWVKQIDASNDPNLLFVFLYHNFLTSTDLELIVCEQRTKDSFLFVTATFPLIRIVRLTLIKEVVNLYHQFHHLKAILSLITSPRKQRIKKHQTHPLTDSWVSSNQGCCQLLPSNINIIWLFSCTLINMAKCGIQSIENGSQRRWVYVYEFINCTNLNFCQNRDTP